MKPLVHRDKPEEQQKKMLQVHYNEGRADLQHIQPILSIFEDLYKGRHVLELKDGVREDQIGLLELEIGSFEGENPS